MYDMLRCALANFHTGFHGRESPVRTPNPVVITSLSGSKLKLEVGNAISEFGSRPTGEGLWLCGFRCPLDSPLGRRLFWLGID